MSIESPKPGFEALSNEHVSNEALEDQAQGENLEALFSAAFLSGVRRVLDVGCGTGFLARRIARALGPEATVYGVDISGTHIERARFLAGEEAVSHVRFIEGDFLSGDCNLPADFDLVIEKYLLMHQVPRKRHGALLARMRDHARPGGRIALIEPDVNFGAERYPPPPEPLASVLPRIVEHYRRLDLIEWRCGLQLFHHLRQAGFAAVKVSLIDGRIICGGAPRALVEHGCRNAEELIEPCLEEMGMAEKTEMVAQQWRDYLRDPGSFLYTPIFLGEGTKSS
jgi:SAM-dependent methyltransferase